MHGLSPMITPGSSSQFFASSIYLSWLSLSLIELTLSLQKIRGQEKNIWIIFWDPHFLGAYGSRQEQRSTFPIGWPIVSTLAGSGGGWESQEDLVLSVEVSNVCKFDKMVWLQFDIQSPFQACVPFKAPHLTLRAVSPTSVLSLLHLYTYTLLSACFLFFTCILANLYLQFFLPLSPVPHSPFSTSSLVLCLGNTLSCPFLRSP